MGGFVHTLSNKAGPMSNMIGVGSNEAFATTTARGEWTCFSNDQEMRAHLAV